MQNPYKSESSNLHKGHRARVKEHFVRSGGEDFTDVQMLEMALFFAIPQGDTNELAHRLMNKFGSISAVLDAPHEQLTDVPGIGDNAASFLNFSVALARRYRLDKIADDNLFENADKIGRYLMAFLMGASGEQTVLMCLDGKRRLLFCEKVFSDGMTEMTPAIVRKIAELALSHRAHGVVLAHNHPSGICEPSEYDITATNALNMALAGVGITLIEHYVITDEEYSPIMSYIAEHGYENI